MLPAVSSHTPPITTYLADQPLVLDPAGGAYVSAQELLVVSDLHFEKGSHFARQGQFIPPYDTRVTLAGVERLVTKYRPRRVLSLGDAFHDTGAEARMATEDAERLLALCSAMEWIWVLGNHDPLPPKRFGGVVDTQAELGGLVFVHEPNESHDWHMAGHLHPCAVATRQGVGVRRGCFITDGSRMVLPAFGAFTGGLNVLDAAFDPIFPAHRAVYMQGREKVFRVPIGALRADHRSMPVWRLAARRA